MKLLTSASELTKCQEWRTGVNHATGMRRRRRTSERSGVRNQFARAYQPALSRVTSDQCKPADSPCTSVVICYRRCSCKRYLRRDIRKSLVFYLDALKTMKRTETVDDVAKQTIV